MTTFSSTSRTRWRGNVLQLDTPHQARILNDQVIEVNAQGTVHAVRAPLPGEQVEHDHRGRLIAPGFIDSHVHFPQLDVIGSPAEGLLPWLENHTFPEEARFADRDHAGEVARVFLGELLRHGVTTAAVYCTAHPESVDAFMQASDERDLAMIAGKVLQDRHSPPALRDDTERSLLDSAALIRRWHGRGRLRYAITPRFAPTSTERQLAGAGELARAFPDVTVQSHVAENLDEIAWVGRLFPNDRSYLSVYDRFGLVRPHSLWGHCIHLDPDDRALLREREAVAAVCPTSNMFLGSGLFNFAAANHPWSLASDIGGGSSLSPFRTMMTAFEVARLGGHYLSPSVLWWHSSTGSAEALGLGDRLGRIQPGYDADWIVIDPQAKPLLARRWAQAETDDAKLFALIVLGDDRNIAETVVRGQGVVFPLEPGA
ncbi:MAG: guanine deaminase [Betaproteobacteria bacterium]|nr:guanine deaminase [Betaproteobacteria bacterium]